MAASADERKFPDELEAALRAAIAQPDQAERQAKIQQAKDAHPALAEAIEVWLYQHGALDDLETDPDETPERQIGPYTLLERIGRGGFGDVYVAEQKEPVHRRVALKLIKIGMDSGAILKRFFQERQVLAALNHEAIAKIFDGGVTTRGRPYFVMEYVDGGKPITDYCDEHKLSIHERIRLFQLVCQGVQHSHQKGILHRDLKPSNILVTRVDDRHVPKIIDFGIAKDTSGDGSKETVYTIERQMLGTPEYMAPEQAAGEPVLTTAVDTYALGVVLYELLAGRLPFPSEQLRKKTHGDVVRVLKEQDPKKPSTKIHDLEAAEDSTKGEETTRQAECRQLRSVAAWTQAVRGDLDWITMMALRKEPERRYPSASEFAADLQRYLDHEPVKARAPTFGYRARKFARKHRGPLIAGTVVAIAITAGGISTGIGFAKFSAKVREFDFLAAAELYERAIDSEKTLNPPWPSKQKAMEEWLKNAGNLLGRKSAIEQAVRNLEGRALPPTPADLEADRLSHPRLTVFESQRMRVESLRYAQAIRSDKELVMPALTEEQKALDPETLNDWAWVRVQPKRQVYGEESIGLACARDAAAKAAGRWLEYQVLDTLAWAYFANGQDEYARETSAAGLAKAPTNQKETYLGYQSSLRAAILSATETLAKAEKDLAILQTEVSQRRTFQFATEQEAFLHDTLADLLTKLDSLEATKAKVNKRLTWAKEIQELSLHHPRAPHSWDEARAAIAKADDVVASHLYRGRPIELRDQDLVGLVPIGMNPVTKLWEFYELRSAWNFEDDPVAIPIPAHRSDGSIEVTDDTGIVFVLLPGGTFRMGAQNQDKEKPSFDPQARRDETPHAVTLVPYFMARHELTQGQWRRLGRGNADLPKPSQYTPGQHYAGRVTWTNPVEQVNWELCNMLLEQCGLELPTEAQWEYACRAGASTPWLCAPEDLHKHGNLADASARDVEACLASEAWNDGYALHAPVGSFVANAFGLYDMQGNVSEWCRDEYESYGVPGRADDGLRLRDNGVFNRCYRGGGFGHVAGHARSAYRDQLPPTSSFSGLGLRCARTLRH